MVHWFGIGHESWIDDFSVCNDLFVIMRKAELEKLLFIEKMAARGEFEKMKKSADIIGWIGLSLMITFSVLLGIGFLALMFFS